MEESGHEVSFQIVNLARRSAGIGGACIIENVDWRGGAEGVRSE